MNKKDHIELGCLNIFPSNTLMEIIANKTLGVPFGIFVLAGPVEIIGKPKFMKIATNRTIGRDPFDKIKFSFVCFKIKINESIL